ncbi:MAG: M55 family metallopeptidase, partial [Candidatus Eremiobacteraeota bacterium]|nr:M55 family metallopeptidase [Candidatus Eremiobacteraeota bacterium]
VRCSEATLNAALLGTYAVPVVLVTGDRTTVAAARAQMPWIVGVETKDAVGRFAVNSLSPALARERIRAGAKEAVNGARDARPFVFDSPIELELDFIATHNADFAELIPGVDRIGGRTVRYVHDDYRVVFRTMMAAMRLGGAANAPV